MTNPELATSLGARIIAAVLLIVQWIERGPPKAQMLVRFRLGRPPRKANQVAYFFVGTLCSLPSSIG